MRPIIATIRTTKHPKIKKCSIKKPNFENLNLTHASKFQILSVSIIRSHKGLYEIRYTYDSDAKKNIQYRNGSKFQNQQIHYTTALKKIQSSFHILP